MDDVRRGEVYFIQCAKKFADFPDNYFDRKTRPAIIVSSDEFNKHSSYVEIVFLTTAKKRAMRTHVPVMAKCLSTAVCENIQTIHKDYLEDYIRHLSASEQAAVDAALRVSLGLGEEITLNLVDNNTEKASFREEQAAFYKEQAAFYKDMALSNRGGR